MIGFKLNSIKEIKQVMKWDINRASTEGMVQESQGSLIKFSAGKLLMQILRSKMKFLCLYYPHCIDFHHWTSAH